MTSTQSKYDYDELVQETRVHTDVFANAEIFEDEMERIFEGWWNFVGHASEVPEPGDYALKRIGRQPVIMCRDEDGNVNLFLNRCRHRGNLVCNYEQGPQPALVSLPHAVQGSPLPKLWSR
jgi:phenylpropionate dioxygenase-like ring-hydroxylating dioxygenase large terminal subunit